MEGLLALLAGDVVLYSDGGGRAVAVPNLVRGADNVARGILGAFRGYIYSGQSGKARTSAGVGAGFRLGNGIVERIERAFRGR